MNTGTRCALSIAVVAAVAVVGSTIGSGVVQTIGLADLAGLQFQNSDAAAVVAAGDARILSGLAPWAALVGLVALLAIWRAPLLRVLAGSAVVLLAVSATSPASAYFNTTDKTEAVTIMPNESAFWIPDVGANKDSQTSFDSEAYYAQNKIALKRFIVPHIKLNNTGGWAGFDSYVPAGRMIIVDRAPYYREWTKNEARGTSARDESAPCQTREGINVVTEVGISASVAEENSPKFLHYFGVNNPAGDRTDPSVIFTSVYYGRSLTQVMDGIGRGLVHTAVCREIGKYGIDEANAKSNQIMDAVQAQASKFFADRGITLEYMGWAGTWTFDRDIQQAINDSYTGVKVGPVLTQLQQKAVIDALEGWDHKLPTTLNLSWWPSALGDALGGLFKTAGVPAPASATAH